MQTLLHSSPGGVVSESLRSRWIKWRINAYPCFRGTGGRVTYISRDFRDWEVKLPLNRRTRNIWGTIFGGSLYASVDPIYGVMLAMLVGSEYVVWAKTAVVRFRKPGRETLRARFTIDEKTLAALRTDLAELGSAERTFLVELKDGSDDVCTSVEATYHVGPRTTEPPGTL